MRLEARDLGVVYPAAERPALRRVSTTVPSGSLTAVLGPNGSGKSTLIRALLGVARPTEGEALVDDRPVAAWNRRELARAVGAVSQTESIAFPLTVDELVGMGRYPHLGPLSPVGSADQEAIRRALEQCDLVELRSRDVTTLSGGELQRARIARALCQEPRALVLDEPTASLDIRHQMAILELLRSSVDDGITVLLVTHSLDRAAQFADHVLLLDAGAVVAEGPPADVFREETLARVYDWPVAVDQDPRSGAKRVTPLRRDGSSSTGQDGR